MASPDQRGERPGPLDELVDLVFYAPIGLVFEARRLTPELVARGRRQVELARVIGKMAVDTGVRQASQLVDRVLADLGTSGQDSSPSPRGEPSAEPTPAPPRPAADPAVAATLAIPEYDSLAATQVIPRLAGLSPSELEAVRAYELAHRGRRTILAKIARLQG